MLSAILETYLSQEKRIKKYLTRFLSNPQDIDEIAQEAFLRAFASEGKQPIKRPRSFLYTTAKHLALDHVKKKSPVIASDMSDKDQLQSLLDEGQLSPEDQLASKELLVSFAKAVSVLPERGRRDFILAKVNGHS